MTYQPQLPAERLERIRQWHETAYQLSKEEGEGGQTFDYLGLILDVPPQVHPVTGMSHLLGEAVLAQVRPGDRVLDMGTGCGVNAILAASAAARVLAVDINPDALAAARHNAERNGVADRVEVRHSDVFSAVDGEFDLIVFDPPYRWFAPRDLLEAASTDEGYRAMTTFVRTARQHLAPGGRILIAFGSSGDLDYLRRLLDEEGFAVRVVAEQSLVRDDWQVDYFAFLVTPAAEQ